MRKRAAFQAGVFIDGSALFFAVRELYPGQQLDYTALRDLLLREFGTRNALASGPGAGTLVAPTNSVPPQSPWIMWTACSRQNEGQLRFLEFIETRLHIAVRRFAPSDSAMIDPRTAASLAGGSPIIERLTRFDASMAYLLGRIADRCQVILLTDSFSLAEPLVRAARARSSALGTTGTPNVVCFFGRALDPRWHGMLNDTGVAEYVRFLDLDLSADELFGAGQKSERSWLGEDVPGIDS